MDVRQIQTVAKERKPEGIGTALCAVWFCMFKISQQGSGQIINRSFLIKFHILRGTYVVLVFYHRAALLERF